jgi:2-polyprenyl-3-methyl-5-hydroxy-6-metoxy-1,4-benzoquinol methylase
MKEQDKQAERDFFNRGMDAVKSDHPCDEAHITECYGFLGFSDQMKGERILECGCGIGDWGRALAKRGANVIGVDIAEAAIEANKRLNADLPNYTCHVGDLEDIDLFEAKSLDGITCFNVLHHFPSIDKVIENFAYWLKDGGGVYAVEPNGGNPVHKVGKIVRKLLPPKLVARKGLATVNEMHDWSMAEYLRCFENQGFKCSIRISLGDSVSMPSGFDMPSLLGKIRWMLYCVCNCFIWDPTNKGNPLIFSMHLEKVKPSLDV